MKLRYLLSAGLVALSTTTFAQTWTSDSVAMGVGYANDVFYELKNGSTKLQAGNDWHLAFQMTVFGEPNFNASIRANHAKTGLEVYELAKSVTATSFANLSGADTIGKTAPALQLLNNDTSWGTGALYQNRNTADLFSYGWGEYSGTSGTPPHSVNGICVYLLKEANGTAFKLWIQKYVSTPLDSVHYTFRIAKLDGSADKTVSVYRKDLNSNYSDRLFAYYNIDSNTVSSREPSRQTWDVLFTQYKQLIPDGMGGFIPYSLTGVLTNQSAEVADVRQMDVNDPAHLLNYKTYPRTSHIDEIGSDWKVYVNPGPNGYYHLDSNTSFFIKTKTDNGYYQLVFTRFDGSSPAGQGKIVFNKRYLGSAVGVKNVASASVNAWYVSPNPASNNASVMIDAKAATPSARLIIMDMAGRTVLNSPIAVHQGMNAFGFNTSAMPSGMYAVTVTGGDWKMSTRLVVAH